MSYVATAAERTARAKALFALYNDRCFDEMLLSFSDDVMAYLPTILNGCEELRISAGKAEYRRNLETFYDIFGKLEVGAVFSTETTSSITVVDERGNPGTFSFEVEPPERRVTRVFFHHQPKPEDGRGRQAA